MCNPFSVVRRYIRKEAFADYAKEHHGWSDERCNLAWDWMLIREAKYKNEDEKAEKAKFEAEFARATAMQNTKRCACSECEK